MGLCINVCVTGSGVSPVALTSLRNSTSENNVNHMPTESGDRRLDGASSNMPACRTLSDGASKCYARRKLESEDSSYDSDYECSDSLSLALTSPPSDSSSVLQSVTECSSVQQQHEDVSRTTSDTLAAEFSEYVSVYNPTFQRYTTSNLVKLKPIYKKNYHH